MPELPDVENFRKTAQKAGGKKIKEIKNTGDQFSDKEVGSMNERLKNKWLETTSRRGKYLFMHTDAGETVVCHFGMTGEMEYAGERKELPRYSKLQFVLDNNHSLVYISKRKLGKVEIVDELEKYIRENEIGPDALDIGPDDFTAFIKGKNSMLKSALMDQSSISGIGNIYSDEIMFQAGLHPGIKCSKLKDKDIQNLYDTMRSVLETTIEKGANPENFPENYLIPRRNEGESCPVCNGEIKMIKISGRGTYFCPSCQKK